MTAVRARQVLLRETGDGEVSNVELFFDLVYVFAVTQLSHLLVEHPSVAGAVQTAVALSMVWQVWAYTTWAVNYLDPNRTAVRAMLLFVMLGSLIVAAAIPNAFRSSGMLLAVAYVAMQLGRVVFSIWAMRDSPVRITFVRILVWQLLSSVAVIAGATQHEHHLREVLWAGALVIDMIGAAMTFFVPGLGRATTAEWTISGRHFAERCQAFVLIALGESVVVIGGLANFDDPTWRDVAGFVAAFLGVVLLWWIYFDHAAGDSSDVIEASDDPGRLARGAFHYLHPAIVAGIIVTAAADERVLHDPAAPAGGATAWFLLGGTALFLGGHAAFKFVVWRAVSWPRVVAVIALAGFGALAPHVSALVLAVCTLAVVIAVAILDRLGHPAISLDQPI